MSQNVMIFVPGSFNLTQKSKRVNLCCDIFPAVSDLIAFVIDQSVFKGIYLKKMSAKSLKLQVHNGGLEGKQCPASNRDLFLKDVPQCLWDKPWIRLKVMSS